MSSSKSISDSSLKSRSASPSSSSSTSSSSSSSSLPSFSPSFSSPPYVSHSSSSLLTPATLSESNSISSSPSSTIGSSAATSSVSSIAPGLCVYLDATGQTNQYGYSLFTLMLVHPLTRRGCPIAHCISASKDSSVIYQFLIFVHKNISNLHIEQILIDKDEAELKGIRRFGDENYKIDIFLCFFHVMQAVDRWLSKSNNKVSNEITLMVKTTMQKCHYAKTEHAFNAYFKELQIALKVINI